MRTLIKFLFALATVLVITVPAFAQNVVVLGTSDTTLGLAPTVTASGLNSLVLKTVAGNLYSAYATNETATAGMLMVFNAVAAPSDGAVTPLACVFLPASGTASLSYLPGPPGKFSTGITIVVSSGATCFTKTTGVITAFISGTAP